MSRRHHHTGREPRTEHLRLTAAAESMLDMLEVETRARAAYDVAELQAVTELNRDRYKADWRPEVEPIPWSSTDPETRRDYRLHVIETMHTAEQLRGDRMARGQSVTDGPTGIRFDL